MYMRGISGKWIGHLAFVAIAKVFAHVLGPHVGLGQQQAIPGYLASIRSADLLDDTCASRAGSRCWCRRARSDREWRRGGSRPRPSPARTPSSSAPRSMHAGLSKFRSGWWLKKRCQKYCCATSSQVQLDFSVSVKMMRDAGRRAVSVVAPDVEIALGRALGCLARCLEPRVLVGLVWFITSSVITRMPAAVRFHDEGLESRRACRRTGARLRSRPRRSRRRAAATDRRAAARCSVDAERLHVVQPFCQATEVTDAVAVGVRVRP